MHLLSPYYYSYPSSSDSSPSMSTFSGIQGHLLEVTVVGCNNLSYISKQNSYVSLKYAETERRTQTCTDGHKNPTFQEKLEFFLTEGLHELNFEVRNSKSRTHDDFIGSGRILLQRVLSQGFDDTAWPLMNEGRQVGEVKFILHYANASNKPSRGFAAASPPVPPYGTLAAHHASSSTASPPAFDPSLYSSYANPLSVFQTQANLNTYPPSVSSPPLATLYNNQTSSPPPYAPPLQTTITTPQTAQTTQTTRTRRTTPQATRTTRTTPQPTRTTRTTRQTTHTTRTTPRTRNPYPRERGF